MTNQDTHNSDKVPSGSNDRENLQSQPDYSTTLKDIEINILRELLKDGVGIADDSNKAIAEIIQETHVKNKRNLVISVALIFVIMGILSFIGYKKLAALKEGELETRRAISAIEEKIVGECTLDGTSSAGKFVFYPIGEPKGYETAERVCALSVTYPWTCAKESLSNYMGKKVFLSIAGFERIVDFTVVDFFSPRDQTRIIQIPMRSVESLVGPGKADKYILKGVIDGKVVFPSEAQ